MTMRLFAAACLTMLLGCASDISTHVDFCCGAKEPEVSTYGITLVAVPTFMAGPLRGALVDALATRGWRESAERPDALITLQYAAVYPDRPLANDGFADPLATGGPRKYDARVTLDVRRASDNAELLRGTLSREHTESVGEYDHRRATDAMRDAFERLVGRLPKA
ncbi:MAG TPA: DUF4136 domain-containing protein [Pseudomonadales bacterium]|nr:DUF4136 domain-containing protein [Pseudomonadales bacterium]